MPLKISRRQEPIFILIILSLTFALTAGCMSKKDSGTITLSDSGEEVTMESNIPSNSDPGDVSAMPSDGTAEEAPLPELIDTTGWLPYINETYGFEIKHPDYFKVRIGALDASEPQLIEIIEFVDSKAELADITTAAFSIRIYSNQKKQTIPEWLKASRFREGDAWIYEKFEIGQISGIKVSSTNYMSPGEYFFFGHKDWVVIFAPIGAEANAMIGTFRPSK